MALDNVTDLTCWKSLQLSAGALQAAGTNPASLASYGLDGAWAFAKALTESITGAYAIPCDIDKNEPPQIRLGWATHPTTGNVKWQLEYKWIALNEDVTSAVTGTVPVVADASGVADGYQRTFFTLTPPDKTKVILEIKLSRIGGEDTLNETAYVVGMTFIYRSDKFGMENA